MFMAFLLRENPIDGWEDRPELLLGLVIGAAGIGNTLGIALASLLRNRCNPAVTVVVALLADAVMTLVAALFYGVTSLALLGLTAGLAQSLAKLSLDSTIQRRRARARAHQCVRPVRHRCCSWPGWSAGSSAS